MSGSLKLGLYLLAAVLVISIGIKLLGALLGMLMPFLILAGVALVIYGLVSRKALGGGRRTLP
jgi:hypothetical protein